MIANPCFSLACSFFPYIGNVDMEQSVVAIHEIHEIHAKHQYEHITRFSTIRDLKNVSAIYLPGYVYIYSTQQYTENVFPWYIFVPDISEQHLVKSHAESFNARGKQWFIHHKIYGTVFYFIAIFLFTTFQQDHTGYHTKTCYLQLYSVI